MCYFMIWSWHLNLALPYGVISYLQWPLPSTRFLMNIPDLQLCPKTRYTRVLRHFSHLYHEYIHIHIHIRLHLHT